MPLSDTARTILTEASQHRLGLAAPTATLPAAARHAVLRSLLRQGLVAECLAPVDHLDPGWRQPDGSIAAMQITDAGRRAVGADESRNAADEAELSGLTETQYQAERDAAQRALDAGIDLSADDACKQAVAAGIIPADTFVKALSESPAAPASRFRDPPASPGLLAADLYGLGHVVAGRGGALPEGSVAVTLAEARRRPRGLPVDLRAALALATDAARRSGGLPAGAVLVVAGLSPTVVPVEGLSLAAGFAGIGRVRLSFA